MTPDDFQKNAIKIYGRKKWKPQLAEALNVDVATIHRMMHRPQIPGPYIVALNGLLDMHNRRTALEKEARKLIPRKFRGKTALKKKLIPYAGAPRVVGRKEVE